MFAFRLKPFVLNMMVLELVLVGILIRSKFVISYTMKLTCEHETEIEVKSIERKLFFSFPIDRWLDSGEGDKRISIDVDASQKPGQSSGNVIV